MGRTIKYIIAQRHFVVRTISEPFPNVLRRIQPQLRHRQVNGRDRAMKRVAKGAACQSASKRGSDSILMKLWCPIPATAKESAHGALASPLDPRSGRFGARGRQNREWHSRDNGALKGQRGRLPELRSKGTPGPQSLRQDACRPAIGRPRRAAPI